MKKLSENLFAPAFDRSRTGELRKEDDIYWVDFGDFYLADRLYEKDRNIYFTYEEAMEMFPEGGEIGLLDEETCEKLKCMIDPTKKSVEIWTSNHKCNINLPLSGANDIPQSKTQTITWIYGESERHPDENVRCCVFRTEVAVCDIDKKAKVAILLMKKKNMNENLFAPAFDRSRTGEKRQEDKSPFDESFEIIKNAELVDLGFDDILWTPFNFGSDSIDKPGYYMTAKEMIELEKYLEGTDYEIASFYYFRRLSVCEPDLVKIGKYWHYKFARNDQVLDVPIFGYLSFYSQSDKVDGILKNNSAFFCCHNKYTPDKYYEYIGIRIGFGWSQFICKRHLSKIEISDKIQVRLVKKIHK